MDEMKNEYEVNLTPSIHRFKLKQVDYLLFLVISLSVVGFILDYLSYKGIGILYMDRIYSYAFIPEGLAFIIFVLLLFKLNHSKIALFTSVLIVLLFAVETMGLLPL